ncbi:MAG TPA: phosphoribosylamine--glycine ligase [Thermoplasmata archaeon]|nr:phosphoribosylamine--glycine ligase [Thermoplasmata archaeon]
MRVLLLGGGAREHALAHALAQAEAKIVVAAANLNPGLKALSAEYVVGDPSRPDAMVALARQHRVDFVLVGPEAPLGAGVGDALRAVDIPVVGPSKTGAQIETSKRYCRELLARHGLSVSPRFTPIANLDEVDARVREFNVPFVVKPVGLTSGKGVKVQGADFQTAEEGATYAKQWLAAHPNEGGLLLEEKVEGEEFSLMAFVTDSGIYPMPIVQDFKRALEGDMGGNTGGMGSYTQRDHLLPFLSTGMRDRALETLRRTVDALHAEGVPFRGVLYGGFMLTANGPVLMEFNARFGDPEGINAATLYEEGDFARLLYGVATGHVDPNLVRFRLRATVVKYLVPPGYPDHPMGGGILTVDEPAIEALGVHVRYGSVDVAGPAKVRLTTSRGLALVGEASAVHEAGARVEEALKFVSGEYLVRHDIGSATDLSRRVEHMRRLFVPGAKPSPLPLSVAPPDAAPASHAPADLLS